MTEMKQHDPNKAIDYIIANAQKFAEAKANRVFLDEFRKSKKALLMAQSSAEAANAREQFAYSHPEYIELLEGIKAAVEIEEKLKWELEAARLRVDVWRSQETSARMQERATQ